MNTTMLSDRIEKFILELLNQQSDDELLIKRKDVADLLECAPSQVTYVINTRFSSDDRFLVESRRGSRGYIRISVRGGKNAPQPKTVEQSTGAAAKTAETPAPKRKPAPDENSIETIEKGLDGYYRMLVDYDIISEREYRLLYAMTHTVLEYCPESHRKDAAKTMVHRVEWALKGD